MELSLRSLPGFALLVALAACAATPRAATETGALATPEPLAAVEGARVLAEGGNAIDAAVCVGFVIAVTHPSAGNLGGGGFLVVHTPDEDLVIDAREMAPAAAHRDMYLDENGDVRPQASLVGPLAAGVPGSVAGYLLLHEKLGTLPRERLLAPAIRLAEEGFVVDRGLAASLRSRRRLLGRFPESARVYLPNGRAPRPGDVLRQPDLARVLRAISEQGRAGFYRGWFAQEVEKSCRENGGVITAADMANYRAVVREPLRGTYRGYQVLTMPPPSSGGVVLLQMLDLLERGRYASLAPEHRLHLFAEAGRRCFADRARYFGDPDFVDVPVARLLDPEYLQSRFAGISMDRAATSGEVDGGLATAESEETCHFSVADGHGNAVACTTTLNGGYGCGLAVHGVLLNNEMDDFTSKPGVPNLYGLIQSAKNAIAPKKRPLSSMTPTILLGKDGRTALVVGSPGGPTIISTVCQVVSNHVALKMSVEQAVAAPRIHHQWLPDHVSFEKLPPERARALEALGHKLQRRGAMGDAQVVGRDAGGRLSGVPDPRGRGGSSP